MKKTQLWFQSTAFEIEPGEDEETNPLCYGKQFAQWLRNRLVESGYSVEEVIPEDWGWCVVVQRKPFMLWIGCVNMHDYAATKPTDPVPKGRDVVWTCHVVAEKSWLSSLFRQIDTSPAVDALFGEVRKLIEADERNKIVEEPR